MDRVIHWVAGVAASIFTVAVVSFVAIVIDLQRTTAVSNAKLESSIDRLADRLEASTLLAGMHLNNVVERVAGSEHRLDAQHERILKLEQTRGR
jgi:hypothetical protein